MKVGVVGTGNVGSALLFHLVDVASIDEILVMNVEDDWSKAAIMDVASAKPEAALKFSVAPFRRIGEPDLLFLTSGVQMKEEETGKDVLAGNIGLMNAILDSAPVKSSAILIGLATPVDDITAHIQKRCGLPYRQVFGFGGDLDRNRLAYVLSQHQIPPEGIGWWESMEKTRSPFTPGRKIMRRWPKRSVTSWGTSLPREEDPGTWRPGSCWQKLPRASLPIRTGFIMCADIIPNLNSI